MDQKNKLIELEAKIDAIYLSVEKTRKYFFWTLVVTLILFILPLIGILFSLPSFLSTYTDTINTLGG
jgi:hypothetical protein